MQASKSNSLSKKTLINHSLLIQGMTCSSCVARIEKALNKISGVQQATVNLATETATIQSTSNVTNEQLIAAVQKTGYQATVARDTSIKNNTQADSELIKVIAGLVLSLPLFAPMLLSVFGIHWMLSGWAQWLLATVVQFWLGARFYKAEIGRAHV